MCTPCGKKNPLIDLVLEKYLYTHNSVKRWKKKLLPSFFFYIPFVFAIALVISLGCSLIYPTERDVKARAPKLLVVLNSWELWEKASTPLANVESVDSESLNEQLRVSYMRCLLVSSSIFFLSNEFTIIGINFRVNKKKFFNLFWKINLCEMFDGVYVWWLSAWMTRDDQSKDDALERMDNFHLDRTIKCEFGVRFWRRKKRKILDIIWVISEYYLIIFLMF